MRLILSIVILIALIMAFIALSRRAPLPALLAPPVADRGPVPDVALQVYQSRGWSAEAGEPVLFFVGINNGDAINETNEREGNRRTLDNLRNNHVMPTDPDALARLLKRYPVTPPEVMEVDSAGLGLAREVSWRITRDGKEIPGFPQPRVLAASAELKGPAVLDGRNPIFLFFGYDDGSIFSSGTEQSPYKFEVIWNNHPEFKSTAVSIIGSPGANFSTDESNIRDFFYGRFERLDRRFDKLETYAGRILARTPGETDGLELHADALAGQGKLKEAFTAFQFVYRERLNAGSEGGLSYATRRLWELHDAMNGK